MLKIVTKVRKKGSCTVTNLRIFRKVEYSKIISRINFSFVKENNKRIEIIEEGIF